MRRFVCASCGKTIEIGWCTNQRGRDLRCQDCGGQVYRVHGDGYQGMGRRGNGTFTGRPDANAGNSTGFGTNREENVFRLNRGRREQDSVFGRNRGGGRGFRRGAV